MLPKFEVTVTAPKDVTYADGKLIVSVKALYTYGESVKGVAQVAISRNNYWDSTDQPVIEKQVNIDGNAVAEFQMDSELKISEQNWQDDFKVTVSVTEGLTGECSAQYSKPLRHTMRTFLNFRFLCCRRCSGRFYYCNNSKN